MNQKQIRQRIRKMSLKEKAYEMTQFCPYYTFLDSGNVATGDDVSHLLPDDFNPTGSVLGMMNAESRIALQKIYLERELTPVLYAFDMIHGYRNLYPIPLAMAGTFDMELIEECAMMAATEARLNGLHITYAPMVDLCRDARCGRVMESGGEDPYLGGEAGKAVIRGYHKGGIACCVKHFAGYGFPEAGKEYNTTDISERNLKEYVLTPYRECMKEQPEMVMTSFNLLNGIPILGHREVMIDTLRIEWGFDGVVISHYSSSMEMVTHGYCEDKKECAEIAMNAKLDIQMFDSSYIDYFPELLAEGKITEAQIDESVERILTLKNMLNLFDNPFGDANAEQFEQAIRSEKHREIVRRASEESCILLKNDETLPLHKEQKIALIGPFAEERDLRSFWAAHSYAEECVTVKEGVENLLGHSVISAVGCPIDLFSNDNSQISTALLAAEQADTVVVCIGEERLHSGEGHSRADISLPAAQIALVKALKTLNKPLVFVVFGGRPLVLTDIVDYANAILYVWHPGTEGGNAIANLLFGIANPCGKAAMSFPRHVGQCPIYYNSFSTNRPKDENAGFIPFRSGYDDIINAPLYPFGYGLSYTTFDYSNFRLDKTEMRRNEAITASVTVTNTGNMDGKETVQLYLHDKFASVVRPIKELKSFQKIYLKAGEQKTVKFRITEEMLKFYSANGNYLAEAGEFEVFLGSDSSVKNSNSFLLID